jgi:hypothetical protein
MKSIAGHTGTHVIMHPQQARYDCKYMEHAFHREYITRIFIREGYFMDKFLNGARVSLTSVLEMGHLSEISFNTQLSKKGHIFS